jgi:dsDNA-specific endonuclease/ATPase MutS2
MSLNVQQSPYKLVKGVYIMREELSNPALTTEERESKLIALAYEHAQSQLEAGTASSQVTVHFLKLGSKRADLELEQAELQNKLLEERIASERSNVEINQLFIKVMEALTTYQGRPEEEFYAND